MSESKPTDDASIIRNVVKPAALDTAGRNLPDI
jgi:hypothetical protein